MIKSRFMSLQGLLYGHKAGLDLEECIKVVRIFFLLFHVFMFLQLLFDKFQSLTYLVYLL